MSIEYPEPDDPAVAEMRWERIEAEAERDAANLTIAALAEALRELYGYMQRDYPSDATDWAHIDRLLANLPAAAQEYADRLRAEERAKWTSSHVHDLSLRDHARELVDRWNRGTVTRPEYAIVDAMAADLAAMQNEGSEFAWLIERSDPTRWWTGAMDYEEGDWTQDAWQARRFTKAEAEAVIRRRSAGGAPFGVAVEHGFAR